MAHRLKQYKTMADQRKWQTSANGRPEQNFRLHLLTMPGKNHRQEKKMDYKLYYAEKIGFFVEVGSF